MKKWTSIVRVGDDDVDNASGEKDEERIVETKLELHLDRASSLKAVEEIAVVGSLTHIADAKDSANKDNGRARSTTGQLEKRSTRIRRAPERLQDFEKLPIEKPERAMKPQKASMKNSNSPMLWKR